MDFSCSSYSRWGASGVGSIYCSENEKVGKDMDRGFIKAQIGFSESNISHFRFCMILISMAFGGGALAEIGLFFGPDGCDNDNIFEVLGVTSFWISFLAVFANGVILLISFFDTEFSSKRVFLWSILHIVFLFIALGIFQESLLQDMFCGSDGPHYDIGAGF